MSQRALGRQFFHAGEDPSTHPGYVHLGSEEAARDRAHGTGVPVWSAEVHPARPHASVNKPLDDWTANVIGHYDANRDAKGHLPKAADLDPMFEDAPQVARDAGWKPSHDVVMYRNEVEDPGSLSVLARASALRNVRRVT